jgi:glycosyltransferase involved in cell wall biosynthesis
MTPQTGVLVPPEDPAALAQGLIALLADEPRRQSLGIGARERAHDFSWERIGRQLLSIYELACEEPPAALAAAG